MSRLKTQNKIKSLRKVLIVTGMSGAGKSTALKFLEDFGYETVDNIPLSLLVSLVLPQQRELQLQEKPFPLAIGVDIRTRDFDVNSFINHWDNLLNKFNMSVAVLFLDCDDSELNRRYTETRHKHPLALDRPVIDGIRRERQLVSALKPLSNHVFDTTNLLPRELGYLLENDFSEVNKSRLTIFIKSFSFKEGLPREADLVFDVRFLKNPYYEEKLRSLTGLDKDIDDFISTDKVFQKFFNNLITLLDQLLPQYSAEGKSYLTIAIGCTGGRHRSVFVAEKLGIWLSSKNKIAQIFHRDIDRFAS